MGTNTHYYIWTIDNAGNISNVLEITTSKANYVVHTGGNNTYTTYCHMKYGSVKVKVGDVNRGVNGQSAVAIGVVVNAVELIKTVSLLHTVDGDVGNDRVVALHFQTTIDRQWCRQVKLVGVGREYIDGALRVAVTHLLADYIVGANLQVARPTTFAFVLVVNPDFALGVGRCQGYRGEVGLEGGRKFKGLVTVVSYDLYIALTKPTLCAPLANLSIVIGALPTWVLSM